MPAQVLAAESSDQHTTAGRIEMLDILRGFALFGMILVHFHQRFRLTTDVQSLPGEELVGWVMWLGVEQKAWATFAFLFGAGFAILMRRAELKGQPLVALYLRRMAVLAVLGAAIHIFTGFQMLMEYALWGVALLFLRHRSTRTLLILAVIAAAASSLVRFGTGLYEVLAESVPAAGAARSVMPEALSYAQAVAQRLETMPSYLAGLWVPGSSFTLFLLGLLAVRHGVFDDPRRHVRLIRGMMAVGLASWLIFWLLLPRMPVDFASPQVVMPIRYGMGIISDQWLAFTYIGALVLLLAFRPRWTARLRAIGVAGRMALTNYVMQCVVIEDLSSPFGLGLALRPYAYVAGALLLFGLQIVLSRRWLSRYRFGPLEWFWRSVTYMRWQPIRIGGREAVPVAAGD